MSNLIIPQKFYASTDVVKIAKDLLGMTLTTNINGHKTSGTIVETEAYKAPEDLASHAKGNKLTPRNKTMFSSPGSSYVYICYGIHHLFNVVTGPKDVPHAVLIRAIEPLVGKEIMAQRRRVNSNKATMVNGPGKLTVAMGIDMSFDGLHLYSENSPVQIYRGQYERFSIICGPRVGMSHHTGESGHWPWRFRIKENKWTSKPDQVSYNW